MSHLGILTLDHWERGDAVTLDDGTTASALSDTKKLGKMAVGIKFSSAATGVLKVVDGAGKSVEIDADTYAKGVWHPVKVAWVKATDSTVAAADFELGFTEY